MKTVKFHWVKKGNMLFTHTPFGPYMIKVSCAMAARTSYTVVGDERELDYKKMISLHDRLLSQDPPHSSPLEHCARAMSKYEYTSFYRVEGWETHYTKIGNYCKNRAENLKKK